MRAVIQRVSKASVSVDNKVVSKIKQGVLILLGIENEDTQKDIDWLCKKIINLRVFNDDDGVMNLSLKDYNGNAIVVSQFTLQANIKKGNRPSYIKAACPEVSKPLYETFIKHFEKELQKKIGTGIFGANMQVELINDGPVTILIDSKNKV